MPPKRRKRQQLDTSAMPAERLRAPYRLISLAITARLPKRGRSVSDHQYPRCPGLGTMQAMLSCPQTFWSVARGGRVAEGLPLLEKVVEVGHG